MHIKQKRTQVTRRQFVFLVLFLMSAAPLVWLNVDPHAGDRLLRWTSNTPQRAVMANATQPIAKSGDTNRNTALPQARIS
jgi:hypothetical protein